MPSILFNGTLDASGMPELTPVSAATPLPVNASVTASIGGFAPGAVAGVTLAVTTTTDRVTLPAGETVRVANPGAAQVYVKLGNSGVTATTSDIPISAGGAESLVVGANTHIAGITASGTTTLNLTGGSGLGTSTGGGSGGGVSSTVTLAAGSAQAGSFNIGQVGGTAVAAGNGTVTAGTLRVTMAENSSGTVVAVGSLAVAGIAASGAAVSGNPVRVSGRAATDNPTAVDNGDVVDLMTDAIGRFINGGKALSGRRINGKGTSTGTTAATIIASPGTGQALVIHGLQISNSSTTGALVTFNDIIQTSGTVLCSSSYFVPGGGGWAPMLGGPLMLPADTPFTFTVSPAVTTMTVDAQAARE